MNSQLLGHFDAIFAAVESIESQLTIEELPPPEASLPPAVTWTILGLLEYQDRIIWAWDTLEKHLPIVLGAKLRNGRVTTRNHQVALSNSKGNVPGMPSLQYEVDGNICVMSDQSTHEEFVFDICAGPYVLASDSFKDYILKHDEPGPAVKRLQQFFPDGQGITVALNYLRDGQAIDLSYQPNPSYLEFELGKRFNAYHQTVQDFLAYWESTALRPHLASYIGDWRAVRTELDDMKSSELRIKSREANGIWLDWVWKELRVAKNPDALTLLQAASSDDFFEQNPNDISNGFQEA